MLTQCVEMWTPDLNSNIPLFFLHKYDLIVTQIYTVHTVSECQRIGGRQL